MATKKSITILMDKDIVTALEKRAKKNFLSLQEQISDILRRSVISSKKKSEYEGKSDDAFIEYFSRHSGGRKRKKAKA